MKNLLFVILFTIIYFQTGFTQTSDVVIRINHSLSGMEVNTNTVATNDMNHQFYLNRLEYYISEIILSYDGGKEYLVEDTWALVDAFEGTVDIELGDLNIDNIEGVTFSIGVDPEHNHLDPTIWPSDHPLAPQFPSMHWGWAAGYRFIALEGYSGSNLNQKIEIHGLGDSNYGSVTIRKQGSQREGRTYIDIDADFTYALKSISINGGLIVHGEGGQAITCLENCRSNVFSPSLNTSTQFESLEGIKLYPNPSNGLISVDFGSNYDDLPDNIIIYDALGREVQRLSSVRNDHEIILRNPGSYLITMTSKGQLVASKKILVK